VRRPDPRSQAVATIRTATEDDEDRLFELARDFATSQVVRRDAFRRVLSALGGRDDVLLLAAEDSSGVVGYLLAFRYPVFHANGPIAWVEEITVREDLRRRGIGRELMVAFERWARRAGCHHAALATRRAEAFYVAIGYERSATYLRKDLRDVADR